MRHGSFGFVSLVLLSCSIGGAAAQQNVCVRAADGAVVCGPVTQSADKPSPNPFDQPAQPLTQPPAPVLPPAAANPPPPNRVARDAKPSARPPQLARRPSPPRELANRPPTRVAHEDVRRREIERNLPPPPLRARRPPPQRYAEIDRRRYDLRPPLPRAENDIARRYDARLRDLEREVHELRAERDAAMRRPPARPIYRGPPPPRYPERDTRRDDRERIIAAQRAPRRAERDRYSDDN